MVSVEESGGRKYCLLPILPTSKMREYLQEKLPLRECGKGNIFLKVLVICNTDFRKRKRNKSLANLNRAMLTTSQ